MILGFFLVAFAVGTQARGGVYFAEPSSVTNLNHTHPQVTQFYFYLQQMAKWSVLFKGEIEFKRKVGPMQARLDYVLWTGKAFVRPSGATGDMFFPNACEVAGVLQFLNSFKPKSGLNVEECSFLAGNYTTEIDWDKNLHEGGDQVPYDPQKLTFTILEESTMLFGVVIQMKYTDLNLYKFMPKD